MKSLEIRQWSFYFGALVVCAVFSLAASTSSSDAATPQRGGAAAVQTAPAGEVAWLGSMVVEGTRIVDLGSMTVEAKRIRWV